jgi:hypothetical protein
LYPGRVPLGEARLQVLARTARILVDLEAAVRRELAADQIAPKIGPAPLNM